MGLHRLRTRDELQRYVDFGHQVYRDNPYWAPPDAHHLLTQIGNEGPGATHARVQPFWFTGDGDRILAVVAAVVDDTYNRRWNESVGHLLFFEALEGQDDVAVSVIHAACDWLGEQGCAAARMSFLPGWQLPLTIDAYDCVPTCFHSYNPAYYHRMIKNAGFVTEHGLVEYQIAFTPAIASEYSGLIRRAEQGGAVLRTWDFARLEEETTVFANLVNDTFAAHWGMPPFTREELAGLTVGLKDLLVPDFTAFAEVDGRPVGFVYALPDLNRAFHAMRGKAPAAYPDEFQDHLAAIDHGMLLIIGVTQGHRGRGINLALAARSYLAMMDRGYKSASYTVVLDDNWPSRRTAEKLGGKVWRNYVAYRRDFEMAMS